MILDSLKPCLINILGGDEMKHRKAKRDYLEIYRVGDNRIWLRKIGNINDFVYPLKKEVKENRKRNLDFR